MSYDVEEMKEKIHDRMAKAIRETFSPSPLITQRWIQPFPNSKPADFRYFGITKIAKALGTDLKTAMYAIMPNLDMRGVNVRMFSTVEGWIDFFLIDPEIEDEEDPKAIHYNGRLVGRRPLVWGEMAKNLNDRRKNRLLEGQ